MDSRKRKAQPAPELIRRVRVRKEDMEEPLEEDWEGVSDSEENQSDDDLGSEDDEDEDENSSSNEEDDDEGSPEPELDASKISFGALAKAQASLPGPRQRKTKPDEDSKKSDEKQPPQPRQSSSSKSGRSLPKGKKAKNAPEEVSSKRPVSRYREVVTTAPEHQRRRPRDPRFDQPMQDARDVERFRRNYEFLDEYRADEMKTLSQALKKAKTPEDKESLKRSLASMEDQKRAREKRIAEEQLLAQHRRTEKGMVRQGKTPFYLKRGEQKKMLLMDRYAGMSQGQVDHAIERRRKKVAGKEKKALPFARRRGAEEE